MKQTAPLAPHASSDPAPSSPKGGLVAILSDEARQILSAAAILQKQGTRFRFIKSPHDLKQIARSCCDNIEVALIEDPLSRGRIREFLRGTPPAVNCPALHTVVLMKSPDPAIREQVPKSGATLIEDMPQNSASLQNLLRAKARRLAPPSPASPSPAPPSSERSGFGALLTGVFEIRTLEEAENLSMLLASNTPEPEKVRVGIWELLSNAIEHGNLGISFEEKTRLLEAGLFDEEVRRRLALERYRGRVARISFSAGPRSIHLQVRDDGPGFDFREFLEGELQLERPNGRGIRVVCRMCFDEFSYVGTGNTVEATVRFCEPERNEAGEEASEESREQK